MGRTRSDPVNEPWVKDRVHDWFKEVGGFSYATQAGAMGIHGIPDRVGSVPVKITQEMVGMTVGIFFGVESKGEHRRREKDGGMSKMQLVRRKEIIAAKGVYHIAYDRNAKVELTIKLANLIIGKDPNG